VAKPVPNQTEDLWPMLQSHLPQDYVERASTIGLIATYPGYLRTKITHIDQVLRLILFMVANGLSLRNTAALASVAGLPQISPVALHKWMRRIGDYIFWLLEQVSDSRAQFSPLRWGGYDIIATDATTVQRPGAKGTTDRVHVALRLSTLRCVETKITTDRVGEHFGGFELMRAGQLWIADRGYANPECVKRADAMDAAVLIRYNLGSLPLYANADSTAPIDVLALLRRKGSVGKIGTKTVWVIPKNSEPIRALLHFSKLPAKAAARARAKQVSERKLNGQDPASPSVSELAGYRALVSTAPASRLSAKNCFILYKLRWQIEIHFKREKSIAGLDALPNFREDTIATWIAAKLLITQLTRKIIAEAKDLETKGATKKKRPIKGVPQHRG
jgi:hypothetical protein